jgi:hypothetical protein
MVRMTVGIRDAGASRLAPTLERGSQKCGTHRRWRQRRCRERRHQWEAAWRTGQIDDLGLQRGYDAVRAIALHADSRGWRCHDLARHPAPEV